MRMFDNISRTQLYYRGFLSPAPRKSSAGLRQRKQRGNSGNAMFLSQLSKAKLAQREATYAPLFGPMNQLSAG